jgi:hypothetical protein
MGRMEWGVGKRFLFELLRRFPSDTLIVQIKDLFPIPHSLEL